MNYIKIITNNKPQMVLAITDYDEKMDYLLDMLNDTKDENEREIALSIIKQCQENESFCIIPPQSEVIDYNEDIMGEPFFNA